MAINVYKGGKIMPNHTYNRLTSSSNVINRLITVDKEEGHYVNFNNVIPMPPHQPDLNKPNPFFADGPLGSDDEEKFGIENCWYGWSINNWGTKWNAYDTTYDVAMPNIVEFFTAWNPPMPVLQKLSEMFPDVTIHLHTEDEGGGFSADIELLNGEIISNVEADYDYYNRVHYK